MRYLEAKAGFGEALSKIRSMQNATVVRAGGLEGCA